MSTNTVSLGNIGKGTVESVRITEATGEITLIFDNGGEYIIEQQSPPIAPTVNRVFLQNDNVMVDFSDGTSTNAGTLSELGVSRVADVRYDGPLDSIIVEYENGQIEALVPVDDIKPKSVISTYLNENDMFIYAVYSDKTIDRIADASKLLEKQVSNTITDVKVNAQNELIVTTDVNEFNLGEVGSRVVVNGVDPEPAPTITDLHINDTTGLLEATFSDGRVIEVGKAQNVIIEGSEIALADAEIDSNGHLIMTVDSETQGIKTIDVGKVRPEDGKDGTLFKSVSISATGHVEFISDAGTKFIAGKVNVNPVINAIVRDKNLVLLKQNGDEVVVPDVVGIDGTDGIGVSDAYIDASGNLMFKMSDSSVDDINAGNVRLPTEVSVHVNQYDEVVFTMSDGTTRNLGVLPIQKSRYVTNIESVEGEISVTYSDNKKEKIGNIDSYPTEASINDDGQLVITLKDGSEITTDESVSPIDGDGIDNIWTEDRSVFISHTIDNRAESIVKEFKDVIPIGIDTIDIDQDTLELTITLTDDTQHKMTLPRGKDAVTITDVYIEGNDIKMEFSDDSISEVTIPNVVGDSVIYKETDVDGNLVFTNISSGEEYVLNVIKGENGVGIESLVYNPDTHEVEMFLSNEDEPTRIPVPPVTDGKSVEDITYDDDSKSLSIQYGGENVDIPLPVGTIQGNSVKNILYNSNTENIEIHFENDIPRNSIYIPLPKPKDGDKITNISTDVDGNLIIESTISDDPITFPVIKGTTPVSITDVTSNSKNLIVHLSNGTHKNVSLVKGVDGVSIDSIAYTSEDNSLTITKTDGSSDSFDNFKGEDGVSISDIIYDDTREEFVFIKTDGSAQEIPFKKAIDGEGINDIYIDNTTNTLVIEHDVGGSPSRIDIDGIIGTDGIDGVGIDTISRNGDDIVFTMSDNTTHTITDIGTSVTNITLNEDGTLHFEMSDGNDYLTENIKGRDGNGRGIKDITRNTTTGGLDFIITDAAGKEETVSTGNIGMVPITNSDINEDGELVFTLVDNSEMNVGRVIGTNGIYVKSINVSSNNILMQVLSDGVNDDIELFEDVKGDDGSHVVGFDVDEITGMVTTELSDGRRIDIGSIREKTQVSIWVDGDAYNKDKAVIHNAGIYVSKVDNNTSMPPSSDWNTVMMSDSAPEAYAPFILNEPGSIFTGDVFINGSGVIGRPSVISNREFREFTIRDANTNLLISKTSINKDSMTIEGISDGSYYLVISDHFKNGYITDSSDKFYFSVEREDALIKPLIAIPSDIDFEYSPTLITVESRIDNTAGVILSTTFTILNVDTGISSTIDSLSNGTETLTPLQLKQDSRYQIQAYVEFRNDNLNKVSSLSNTIELFTSNDSNNLLKKPNVFSANTDNDLRIDQVVLFASKMKKSSSATISEIPIQHISSDWEVVDNLNIEVFSITQTSAKTSFHIQGNLVIPDQIYKARTRQHSDIYGTSEWSEWYEFRVVSDLSDIIPNIYSSDSLSSFPNQGVVSVDEISTSEVISSEWRITDPDTDQIIFEANHYIDNLYSLTVPKFEFLNGSTVNLSMRFKGRWSNGIWTTVALTYDNNIKNANPLLCNITEEDIIRTIDPYNNGINAFSSIESPFPLRWSVISNNVNHTYLTTVKNQSYVPLLHTLSNDTVIIVNNQLLCYEPLSGETIWQYNDENISFYNELSMEIMDDRFVAIDRYYVYILSTITGELIDKVDYKLDADLHIIGVSFNGNIFTIEHNNHVEYYSNSFQLNIHAIDFTIISSIIINSFLHWPGQQRFENNFRVFFDDNDVAYVVYPDVVKACIMHIVEMTPSSIQEYSIDFSTLSPDFDIEYPTYGHDATLASLSSLKIEDDIIYICFGVVNNTAFDIYENKVFRYRISTNNLSIINTNTKVGDVYQLLDTGDYYEQILCTGYNAGYNTGDIQSVYYVTRDIDKNDFSIVNEVITEMQTGKLFTENLYRLNYMNTINGRSSVTFFPKRYKYVNLRMNNIRVE